MLTGILEGFLPTHIHPLGYCGVSHPKMKPRLWPSLAKKHSMTSKYLQNKAQIPQPGFRLSSVQIQTVFLVLKLNTAFQAQIDTPNLPGPVHPPYHHQRILPNVSLDYITALLEHGSYETAVISAAIICPSLGDRGDFPPLSPPWGEPVTQSSQSEHHTPQATVIASGMGK